MQEGDLFSFGTDAGSFVDEPKTLGSQASQFNFNISDSKAKMMQAGAFRCQKLGDGGLGRGRLEKFEALVVVVNELNPHMVGIGFENFGSPTAEGF